MSHFLDRLMFFKKDVGTFAGGHGIVTREDRTWEDAYRNRWSHDRIVRSTHGVNCTGSCSWKIYVKGGIVTWETQQTDYPRTRPDLPDHEPRGCQRGASASWYLYSGNRIKYPLIRKRLLKQWRAARKTHGAGRGVGLDRRRQSEVRRLQANARPRRLRAHQMGRSERDHRRREHLHRQDTRPRPHHRLLADPRDVDGLLRRGLALPVAHRRRLHVVLRLVLRPAGVEPADLGRTDRRSRKRRLVQLGLPDPVGLERPPDAHARRAFLFRGPLQGHQERRHLPRLQRSVEILRPLAVGAAGHGRGAGDGLRPRDPERIPRQVADAVLHGLRPQIHRLPVPRSPEETRRPLRAGTLPARQRLRRQTRPGQQPGLEDGRGRRDDGQHRLPARLDRLPLGRRGQVESAGESRRRPRDEAGAHLARPQRRRRRGRLPVLRRSRARTLRQDRPRASPDAQRADQAPAAGRRRDAGRLRL